jgi:glycosyltransferase involved in cell wall biosynthesis
MLNNPKVSVCVMTYNHENLIKNCLDSLIHQKCDFDFEIIIGEDCSTDNTRAIVQDYAKKYPGIVKLLLHEENVGGEKNYLLVHEAATGEYICNMDGDDFALPGKLQAQADFMDKTPDCNIAFHRVNYLYPDGSVKEDNINYQSIKNGFRRRNLLQYMAVATHSSKMYRKNNRQFEMPDFIVSDFYMNVEQVLENKAYYINDEIYGVYRVGIGQSTQSKDFMKRLVDQTLKFFLLKYPENKAYINALYLLLLVADIRNYRNPIIHLKGWVRSFSIYSVFLFFKNLDTIKMFKTAK